MPLIGGSIPNFVQGVSQQAPALRLPSQCEAQENAIPSLVEGLLKRPPLEHVAQLDSSSQSGAKIHFATRDLTERYVFILTDGDLKVYDRDTGAEKTVNFPDGKGYLNVSGSPRNQFRLVTIADTTFLVNREKTVAMDPATTASQTFKAIVSVKTARDDVNYQIKVDGTEVAKIAVDTNATTDKVATELKTELDTNLPSGFETVEQAGPVLLIEKTDGSSFEIATWNGYDEDAMTVATTERVQRFDDLPHVAPDGFTTKVTGDQTNNFDHYYVVFDANAPSSTIGGQGVWTETVKPGIKFKFDPTTMPHKIVREADGTFTFQQATWGDREVGDEELASDPSFVGEEINEVFFAHNRLGFLADDNVILSRVGEYFNFWPGTAKTVLDSDPVDLGAASEKVAILYSAIPFDRKTVIFSDQTQWVLEGGQIFTPKNASLDLVAEYESDPDANPAPVGNTVFFAFPRGGFTSLNEMEIVDDQERLQAFDATEHTPKYVPAGARKLATSKSERVLSILTDEEADALYVYNWHWSRRSKDQSAWHKFTFNGAELLDCEFYGSDLWVVYVKDGKTMLGKLGLSPGRTDPNQTFLTRLDYRVDEGDCTVSYDSGNDETTITLPFGMDDPQVVLRGSDQGVVKHTGDSGVVTQIVINGDLSAKEFYAGERFLWRYKLSEIHYRPQSGDGSYSQAIPGRLTIKNMILLYNDTGYFEVKVTPKYRSTYTYKFTGKVIGQGENKIGDVALRTGEFRYPVASKNDRVTIEFQSDSFLPVNLLSAEWEGMLTVRSRRR